MLLSAMIREAGLDPFEAGDVYAQWAALRPPSPRPREPPWTEPSPRCGG